MANPIITTNALYPLPSRAALLQTFLGRHISEVPTPAAIIDRSVVKKNCDGMLQVCQELNVPFRAHVKSHKTLEIARLQAGPGSEPARFIVSTLIEAENLIPLAQEYANLGRKMSILYGVPFAPSAIPRILEIARVLNRSEAALAVLVDNADAFIELWAQVLQQGGNSCGLQVYIKVDTGYHRAGISPTSPSFPALVRTVSEKARAGFQGLYSHGGHSYAGDNEDAALAGLLEELEGLEKAVDALDVFSELELRRAGRGLILSVGATPTATSAQQLLINRSSDTAKKVINLIQRLDMEGHVVEFHAGVYPLLDLQQVATHARPASQGLAKENIALKILLEVASVYDERSKPEALVSAGSLALGREPCKSYPGWGIVASIIPPPGFSVSYPKTYDERGDKTGWIVGRVSQEHGILTWEGPREACQPLFVEEKVLVWPNHACVAGAGFGWYLVVDKEVEHGTKIVDVWVRGRGW